MGVYMDKRISEVESQKKIKEFENIRDYGLLNSEKGRMEKRGRIGIDQF